MKYRTQDFDMENEWQKLLNAKGVTVGSGINAAANNVATDNIETDNANNQDERQAQLDTLMKQIMNRDEFSYNPDEDALYQQYKDQYIQQGKMAMEDAIGQVSSMTGGYGNSYAQSVGLQQYQQILNNLGDVVPDFYQAALDKYTMEGQDLLNQYAMVTDRWNMDFQKQQYEESKNSIGNTDTLWYATGLTDDKGNPIFRDSNGNTQVFAEGINPYTGTKNADAKHGTFSNGYQPDNIGGTKLKYSGVSTGITGKNQTIWEANGKYWLWREDLNEYVEVDISDLD